LAKGLVVFTLFLAVPVAMLMIDPVHPAPGASEPMAASGKEGRSRTENWLVPPAAVTATSPEKGQRIFLRDCAHCHGQRGDGVSPNMQTLHPAPFDLTTFELADSFIRRAVRDGVPGTDMPGWRLGSEEDVRAVSAYTARLGRSDTLSTEERYAPPEALHEAGRRIYTMHCVSCHGELGHGDGPDAAQHLPRPASFAEMRPSYAAARRVIENGVHGTAMPSWPLLTSPEIQAVTFYVRTLYTNSRTVAVRP
jgi:mono/diheme cytochrome c family protein